MGCMDFGLCCGAWGLKASGFSRCSLRGCWALDFGSSFVGDVVYRGLNDWNRVLGQILVILYNQEAKRAVWEVAQAPIISRRHAE